MKKRCALLAYVDVAGVCDLCGTALPRRHRRWCDKHANWYTNNHVWNFAREAARRRDKRRCVKADESCAGYLEVNHIDPRNGAGYGPGCHHHLDNLETLCHAHHVVETNKQRKARSAISNA